MEKILIGKIVNVAGLRGEVKIYNYSDSVEIYETTPKLYVEQKLMEVQKVRTQKNMVILKLAGIDDRDAAERLRGSEVFVTEADLPALPAGQFYVRDLIGMTVKEEDGTVLGTVSDVIQNSAQDIFEVKRTDGKTLLIPKVDQFILQIDGNEREIRVRLIEGMLDL